jgi:hypothetical protein
LNGIIFFYILFSRVIITTIILGICHFVINRACTNIQEKKVLVMRVSVIKSSSF